jgi:hypothetical protein
MKESEDWSVLFEEIIDMCLYTISFPVLCFGILVDSSDLSIQIFAHRMRNFPAGKILLYLKSLSVGRTQWTGSCNRREMVPTLNVVCTYCNIERLKLRYGVCLT